LTYPDFNSKTNKKSRTAHMIEGMCGFVANQKLVG